MDQGVLLETKAVCFSFQAVFVGIGPCPVVLMATYLLAVLRRPKPGVFSPEDRPSPSVLLATKIGFFHGRLDHLQVPSVATKPGF